MARDITNSAAVHHFRTREEHVFSVIYRWPISRYVLTLHLIDNAELLPTFNKCSYKKILPHKDQT